MFDYAVIFPRHVEGHKLDRTVWNLSTFHAYVSYHVKVWISSNQIFQLHRYVFSIVMTMYMLILICYHEDVTIFCLNYYCYALFSLGFKLLSLSLKE